MQANRNRKAGATRAILCAATVLLPLHQLGAQVRLEDVFTSATLAGERPAPPDAATMLDATIAALGAALDRGDHARVRIETERILSVLDKADLRYPGVLHLRARAFEDEPDPSAIRALAAEYLRLAPKGPHARWFHSRLARLFAGSRNWDLAANAWKAAAEAPAGPLAPEEALQAAEAMGRAGYAEPLRKVLLEAGWQDWPPEQRDRAEVWFLDSLLVQDDPAALPPSVLPRTGPALARYALLMTLRRDHERANLALTALESHRSTLGPAEAESLLSAGFPR